MGRTELTKFLHNRQAEIGFERFRKPLGSRIAITVIFRSIGITLAGRLTILSPAGNSIGNSFRWIVSFDGCRAFRLWTITGLELFKNRLVSALW